MYVCLCTPVWPVPVEARRGLGYSELDLQIVVSFNVGAKNQTLDLWKRASTALNY